MMKQLFLLWKQKKDNSNAPTNFAATVPYATRLDRSWQPAKIGSPLKIARAFTTGRYIGNNNVLLPLICRLLSRNGCRQSILFFFYVTVSVWRPVGMILYGLTVCSARGIVVWKKLNFCQGKLA